MIIVFPPLSGEVPPQLYSEAVAEVRAFCAISQLVCIFTCRVPQLQVLLETPTDVALKVLRVLYTWAGKLRN